METGIAVVAFVWAVLVSFWSSWGTVIACAIAGAIGLIIFESVLRSAVKAALLDHILEIRRINNRLIERTAAIEAKVDALIHETRR